MARTTVELTDESFNPVRTTVAPGTTIVWENTGSTDHVIDSVRFHDTATHWQFRTQPLPPGDSAIYTFDHEGIYEYYCGLHGEDTCGVILVGDVSLPSSLPVNNDKRSQQHGSSANKLRNKNEQSSCPVDESVSAVGRQ